MDGTVLCVWDRPLYRPGDSLSCAAVTMHSGSKSIDTFKDASGRSLVRNRCATPLQQCTGSIVYVVDDHRLSRTLPQAVQTLGCRFVECGEATGPEKEHCHEGQQRAVLGSS